MQFRIKTILLFIVYMAAISWFLRPFYGTDSFGLILVVFLFFPALIVFIGFGLAVIHIRWFEPKQFAKRSTAGDRSPGLGAGPRPLTANYLLRLRPHSHPNSSPEFGPPGEELRLKPLDDR